MRREAPIRVLMNVIRGDLPRDNEWLDVIALANRAWLGPTLHLILESLPDVEAAPADVREYLGFLYQRNLQRNLRLRAQLIEAVGALNAAQVEPVLLKGAIRLFAAADERLGARMLSDLDLSLDPSEEARARAALGALGYREVAGVRTLGRPKDVGSIELRCGPSPRSRAYLSSDIKMHAEPRDVEGAVARVPWPTAQALHLIVHDMIKEGDYWRWRMDLRHMQELAELARGGELDWDFIAARLADPAARRALAVQAVALADLFGAPVPQHVRSDVSAKWIHAARVAAVSSGAVRLVGNLNWGMYRLRTAHAYRWQGGRDCLARIYQTLFDPPKGARL